MCLILLNNNIISLIQGKNELKEYEMNINSPKENRQTYYLSNQFANMVNNFYIFSYTSIIIPII